MLLSGGAEEFAIVALVALIVVGPKDLPVLMRKVGRWVGKMRSLAAEFRSSFDELARQSELDELRKEVEALRRGQLADIASHAGGAESAQIIDDIHQGLADVGVQLHPPMSYQYAEAAAEAPPVTIAAEAPKPKAKKPAAKKAPAKPKAKAAAKPGAKTPAAKKAKP